MLAIRNLARRKGRSALTGVGVAVGVATVVALTAAAQGIRRQFDDFFAAGQTHLVLTRAGAADPFISYLPDELLEGLRAEPIVAAAHPFLFAARQIPGRTFFFYYGTTENSPFLARVRIVRGRGLFEAAGPPRRICLGRRIAEDLGLLPGSTIALGDETFEVVGVFESATPLLEAGGLLPFADAQRLAGLEGRMSSALVQLRPEHTGRLAEAEAKLEVRFPEVEATAATDFSRAFAEFDLAEEAVTVITALALLVGGIGVMNTMLMSVLERTREIGILQAIGWSRGMILRHVLAEGLVVCALGAPLGIALGIAAVEGVAAVGELSWVGGNYDAVLLVEALAVAVGMGLVGAAYPALRAVRITPVEALRYE